MGTPADRHELLGTDVLADGGEHAVDHLRLHAEDDHVALQHHVEVDGADLDAVLLGERFQAIGVHVGDEDHDPRENRNESDPDDERGGHVAADEAGWWASGPPWALALFSPPITRLPSGTAGASTAEKPLVDLLASLRPVLAEVPARCDRGGRGRARAVRSRILVERRGPRDAEHCLLSSDEMVL